MSLKTVILHIFAQHVTRSFVVVSSLRHCPFALFQTILAFLSHVDEPCDDPQNVSFSLRDVPCSPSVYQPNDLNEVHTSVLVKPMFSSTERM